MSEYKKIVKVKCLEYISPTGKKEKKIYNGARLTLAPILNKTCRGLETGHERDKYDEYSKEYGFEINDAYFKTLRYVMTNKDVELDLSVPEDMIQYKVLQAHPWVAVNEESVNQDTLWVLFDEVAQAEKDAKKMELVFEAYGIIGQMSQDQKADFLKLFGQITKSVAPAIITNKLKTKADNDPEAFIQRFKDKNKAEKILLQSLWQAEIIRKEGQSYFFEETLIGANEDLAVAWLKDLKNQETKIALIEALNEKNRF